MFAATTYRASDPDEYVGLIRGARVEMILAQRGSFEASITRIDLGNLWMQRGRETLGRTFRAVMPADRVILWFLSSPQPPVTILSDQIRHDDLVQLSPGQMACWRSLAPSEWSSMSLPLEEFRQCGIGLTGRDLMSRDAQEVLQPATASKRVGAPTASAWRNRRTRGNGAQSPSPPGCRARIARASDRGRFRGGRRERGRRLCSATSSSPYRKGRFPPEAICQKGLEARR